VVIVRHETPLCPLRASDSRWSLGRDCQNVLPGDAIGKSGNSGSGAAPHLHFDVTKTIPAAAITRSLLTSGIRLSIHLDYKLASHTRRFHTSSLIGRRQRASGSAQGQPTDDQKERLLTRNAAGSLRSPLRPDVRPFT